MKKAVLMPVEAVFCDGCGKQIMSDYYVHDKDGDFCAEYCKEKKT
jgi:hypothetical protein